MPVAPAKLRFQKLLSPSTGNDDWGEITLFPDGSARLTAGDGLRARLARTADRVDKAALLYGSGAFMAVASVGTAFILRRKNGWGYFLFVVAALIALSGSRLRTAARNAPRVFDSALEKGAVVARLSDTGILTITLTGEPWKATTLRLEPGEFDPQQAREFIAALHE